MGILLELRPLALGSTIVGSMIKTRRMIRLWARRVAPLLAWYAALAVLFLGADAARDWHRHSLPSVSFVHLHPHVSDHNHDEGDHRHGEKPDHGSPSSDRGQSGTLSLASGAESTAPPAAPEVPSVNLARSTLRQPADLGSSGTVARPWTARGPPA